MKASFYYRILQVSCGLLCYAFAATAQAPITIQWDKTFGGSGGDVLHSAIPTSDGGYLLAGSSKSDASGDKTEDNKGGCNEYGACPYDYWIIKVVELEEEAFFLKSFTLVNADSDEELLKIKDGDVIDLAKLSNTKFSIVVTTEPAAVGSVDFSLKGPFIHQHSENYAPYAIFGDNPRGDFSGRLLPPGEYTLVATPYKEKQKAGAQGLSLEVSFTIINSEEVEDAQVTGFDLYDAVTDQKLMDLEEGTVIHKDELNHEEMTVLIHTIPDFVGSVSVELQGPMSLNRIENTKPYALFRNNSKDLFGQALPAGDYHLKATPYTEANAQGEAGLPLEVNFTVHTAESSSARIEVFPVPTTGVVHITHDDAIAGARMMLQDDKGNALLSRIISDQPVEQLDLSSYRKGIYYLKIASQDMVQVKCLVVE